MTSRERLRPDGIPTRCDMSLMTSAELAITTAMNAVEITGASIALTDAITLLGKARERVADHVEGRVTDEQSCPGHAASDTDPKICRHCGTHIDSLRPEDD